MLTLFPTAAAAVDSLLHDPEVPDDAGLRIGAAGQSQFSIQIVAEPASGRRAASSRDHDPARRRRARARDRPPAAQAAIAADN
jgi:hypothetical protein